MNCNDVRHLTYQTGQGQWWEMAVSPENTLLWQQQIKGQGWESSREAVDLQLQQLGLCTLNPGQQTAAVGTAPPLPPAPTSAAPGGDGAMGLLLVIGLAGSAAWAWLNRDKDTDPDYHPMADVPLLPPIYIEPLPDMPLQGNSSHGIPTVEADQFAGNSREFEGNSQIEQSANSLGIPGVTADSQDWPPKSMGAPFDPLEPEQAGEFEAYQRHLDKDGLSPKGNDIIKVLWGATPGRSSVYEAARRRRDEFAKRLDYYRYEGA